MTTIARRGHLCAVFLAIAVFLVPAGSRKGDRKEDDTKGADGKGGDNRADADARPDFSLTSKQFSEEYDKEEKAAEAKYKGKVIELSGLIIGMGRNVMEDVFLKLEGSKNDHSGVYCFMA